VWPALAHRQDQNLLRITLLVAVSRLFFPLYFLRGLLNSLYLLLVPRVTPCHFLIFYSFVLFLLAYLLHQFPYSHNLLFAWNIFLIDIVSLSTVACCLIVPLSTVSCLIVVSHCESWTIGAVIATDSSLMFMRSL
jgi:hypothetical protein